MNIEEMREQQYVYRSPDSSPIGPYLGKVIDSILPGGFVQVHWVVYPENRPQLEILKPDALYLVPASMRSDVESWVAKHRAEQSDRHRDAIAVGMLVAISRHRLGQDLTPDFEVEINNALEIMAPGWAKYEAMLAHDIALIRRIANDPVARRLFNRIGVSNGRA